MECFEVNKEPAKWIEIWEQWLTYFANHIHAQPHTRIAGMGEMPTCTQRHPGRNVGIDLPIRPPTRKQTICISRRRTTIPISFFVLRFSITTPAIVKLQPISDTLITIIWTVRIWKLWEYIPEISKDDFFQSRLLDRVSWGCIKFGWKPSTKMYR